VRPAPRPGAPDTARPTPWPGRVDRRVSDWDAAFPAEML
jgi:hypothetical protein